jgi:phage-related protein
VQGFAIGLGAALTLVAGILWGTYIPAWTAAAVAQAIALAPILAITAAVIAFGAAVALVWEDVQAFLHGQPSLLGELVKKYEWVAAAVRFIGDAWGWLKEAAGVAWSAIRDGAQAAGGFFEGFARVVTGVFSGIWQVAGPILALIWDATMLLLRVNITVFRGILAVATEVFQALAPVVMPVLQGIGDFVKWLGGVFAAVAKAIWGEWGAMFDRFVERLNFVIGLVRSLMGLAEKARQGVEGAIDRSTGRAEARSATQQGQRQLAGAARNPLAAQTPNSVAASGRAGNTRQTNVKIDKVEVQTQATDADGISKSVGASLGQEMRRTAQDFDDGVAR